MWCLKITPNFSFAGDGTLSIARTKVLFVANIHGVGGTALGKEKASPNGSFNLGDDSEIISAASSRLRRAWQPGAWNSM